MFPQLLNYSSIAILLLRIMAGSVYASSGWYDLKDPEGRGKSIGMSKGFTIFLGVVELAGGLAVIFGVLTQLAAAGLILLALGAIWKKVFAWHTGFWGKGSQGWHYDLMLALMNLVIITTDGGQYVLWKGPQLWP